MICTQCKEKEITSPHLTGKLCTSCFFEKRKKENELSTVSETPRLPNGPINETGGVNQRDEDGNGGTEENDSESEGTSETIEREKPPIVSQSHQRRDDSIKYCQSCEERGFGLVPATREWTDDYFICDDCFQPLLNNIIAPTDENLRIIKSNPTIDSEKPLLNQFYDLLEIPEAIRFQNADKVLNSRNDIFNYHAPAIINKDVKQVASEIEQLQVMLYQIKIAIEPRQDYINRVKHAEREKSQLGSIEKGKKEFAERKGPSKVKASQDEKMAKTLFGHIKDDKKRLEAYLALVKESREAEFKKRTGT